MESMGPWETYESAGLGLLKESSSHHNSATWLEGQQLRSRSAPRSCDAIELVLESVNDYHVLLEQSLSGGLPLLQQLQSMRHCQRSYAKKLIETCV